jgi:hypothetical protein
VCQTPEDHCREGGWSEVISHGHIEEESSIGASTHKLVLREVSKNGCAGNLILRGNIKGPV